MTPATLAVDPQDTMPLMGEAAPSPAGPISEQELAALPSPPGIPLPRTAQVLRFSQRQIEFVFGGSASSARRSASTASSRADPVITSHPDHVQVALHREARADAPSLTGESPLRPIVGPNSMLTADGERHMRQRKLLLPSFHGEADRAVHGDDRGGRAPRDRPLADGRGRSRSRPACRRSRST